MAAHKDKAEKADKAKTAATKTPRSKPPEPPPDDIDSGWFDDEEAPTTLKAPRKVAAPTEASKPEPKSSKPVALANVAPSGPGPGAVRAAQKLLPARRHTVEVQLDWLEPEASPEPEKEKTIPVEAEWLEVMDADDEPPTVARGRRGPPPIPGPPPLPRDVADATQKSRPASKPASKPAVKPASRPASKPPKAGSKQAAKPSAKPTPPRRKH